MIGLKMPSLPSQAHVIWLFGVGKKEGELLALLLVSLVRKLDPYGNLTKQISVCMKCMTGKTSFEYK